MSKFENQVAFMRSLIANKGECNWASCGPTNHGLVCSYNSCPIYPSEATCFKGNAEVMAKDWLQKNVIAQNLELI
jgi:hypothetical protein